MFKIIKKLLCEDGLYRVATMFNDYIIGEIKLTEHTIDIVTKNINRNFIPHGRYDIILDGAILMNNVCIVDMESDGDEVRFHIVK